MGASNSKNISNVITKAVAEVSSNIIQNTEISQNQSQIISVSDVEGDVYISGNKFTQKATINMHTLLDALSTEEAQQSLIQSIAQESKSITSGLNLGQFANTNNTINTLLEGSVSLMTTISQTCSAFTKQHQAITVERIIGNVHITNNVFTQMYDILQNCSETAVSENKLIQDVVNQLDQSATAEAKGISGFFLALIAIALLGIPIIGVMIGGYVILKFLFPIIMVVGLVLVILYYATGDPDIKYTAFSSFIKNTSACTPISSSVSTAYPTAFAAAKACLEDESCEGFDWKAYNVNSQGLITMLNTPETTFFGSIAKNCEEFIKPDNMSILRKPVMFQSSSDPANNTSVNNQAKKGDVYLNQTTTEWYKKNIQWEPQGPLITISFRKIYWGYLNPKLPNDIATINNLFGTVQLNDYYISTNKNNPIYFYIYQYLGNGWAQVEKIKGSGLVPAAPDVINSSGIRYLQRKPWMLYAGIASLIIGALGTGFAFYQSRQQKRDMLRRGRGISRKGSRLGSRLGSRSGSRSQSLSDVSTVDR